MVSAAHVILPATLIHGENIVFLVLSLAKNLNKRDPAPVDRLTQLGLLAESEILMEALRGLAPQQITELMHVSDKIVPLSAERNATWHTPLTPDNTKQAVFMFNGDVYEGSGAVSFTSEQTGYLQRHVRLLSGLYGALHPLDLTQPYRLEMGTPFVNPRGRNPYESWGGRITGLLNDTLAQTGVNVLVNLALQEYSKSVDARKLNARLITFVFKDERDGKYEIISFYAKRARGLMACYAAKHGTTDPEQLKGFDCEGYHFNEAASGVNGWAFLCEE